MNELINVKRVTATGKVVKTVNREKMIEMMRGIRDSFVDNNQISTMLVEYLPMTEEVFINEIRNTDLDIPFIRLVLLTGKSKIIHISRNHKVIWTIFNELTSSEEM